MSEQDEPNPLLPKGKRHDDPPEQTAAFRARLALAKHPVYVGMTISMVIATIALALVLGQQGKLDSQKVNSTTLRQASLSFCRALQRQRERSNRNSAVVYLTLATSGANQERLAESARTAKAKRLGRATAKALLLLAHTAEYSDPTNCKQAVDHPKAYKVPEPRPYTLTLAEQEIPGIKKILSEVTKPSSVKVR